MLSQLLQLHHGSRCSPGLPSLRLTAEEESQQLHTPALRPAENTLREREREREESVCVCVCERAGIKGLKIGVDSDLDESLCLLIAQSING